MIDALTGIDATTAEIGALRRIIVAAVEGQLRTGNTSREDMSLLQGSQPSVSESRA